MELFDKKYSQRRNTNYLFLGLSTALLIFLAACGPAAPPVIEQEEPIEETVTEEIPPTTAVQEQVPAAEEAYPPPPPTIEFPAVDAYPIDPPPPTAVPTPSPESYPAAEEVFAEPRFHLDQPLIAGSTTVTGQAPPDLSLAIVDVTYNGILLGTGVSDAEGNFTINVQELPEGNRIGITFAELQPGKTLIEMSEEYFSHRGEGFMNLPNVGIFFDTAMVEQ